MGSSGLGELPTPAAGLEVRARWVWGSHSAWGGGHLPGHLREGHGEV